MQEKQEYTIPGNVSGNFEVMQNVTLKDLLCFLPSLLLDIPVLLMPITMYIKIPIVTITMVISAVFVYVRPVRENIPFWQHARELLRFATRQRVYYYRKEVLYEEHMEEAQGEAGTTARAIRPNLNTSSGS
ncbi:hypothetical protein [Bacillus sp. 165]|uniref:hypothetical protein n=1 Tax=Bacillus sp. 165 TaxID=1529117 RepID=UPI001ADA597E|nr:hypothetical protein [Bacillus sp. 165]MBO9128969.1 hypothetical protein [Bacillus sp. 165]